MTTQNVSTGAETPTHTPYTKPLDADAAIAKHCEAVVAKNPRGTAEFAKLATPDGTEFLSHLIGNTT